LTRDEIAEIAAMASVDEMFSWRSPSARQYRDQRGKLIDDQLIDLMLEEPRLIRRPILITGNKVLFGFDADEYKKRLG
jgi:arsenate reductase-like glutaredoxin family protein